MKHITLLDVSAPYHFAQATLSLSLCGSCYRLLVQDLDMSAAPSKRPASSASTIAKRPATALKQSHLCKGLSCVFNRGLPGMRARSDKATNRLCMWCDPAKLRQAESTAGGQANIFRSLTAFSVKPDVLQHAENKLSQEFKDLSADCKPALRQRREDLRLESEALEEAEQIRKRECFAMACEDALLNARAQESRAMMLEDYVRHPRPDMPPRPSYLHATRPVAVMKDWLDCEHMCTWECPINSVSKPPAPTACRYCTEGFRPDDPPPLFRYGELVPGVNPTRRYNPVARYREALEMKFLTILDDGVPVHMLPPSKRLIFERFETWQAIYHRWLSHQEISGNIPQESYEDQQLGGKTMAQWRKVDQQKWGREQAGGALGALLRAMPNDSDGDLEQPGKFLKSASSTAGVQARHRLRSKRPGGWNLCT